MQAGAIRQRRADAPLGVAPLARATYNRYGLPLMITETSVDGPPIARDIWLQRTVAQCKTLREEGIPMLGLIWWPMFDQVDWDGALRHRIGKLHRVGLYTLNRQKDGTLERAITPLAKTYANLAASGDEHVGEMTQLAVVREDPDPQLPPLMTEAWQYTSPGSQVAAPVARTNGNGHANGNGNGSTTAASRLSSLEPAPGLAGNEQVAEQLDGSGESQGQQREIKSTDAYGIVVFSHLRWGFVWQRPQQFLSRFAMHHPVLFVEEPFFDLPAGSEPRVDLHGVMPNVTVACVHCPPEMLKDPKLPSMLREWARHAIDQVNGDGSFDQPLLWYYSPMDSAWSLGHFANRGVVYDCMDELSQFTGAPKQLIDNEKRLIDHADVVFTGGYELWQKKSQLHPTVHFYGCGVEFEHFNQASQPSTAIPPDIDFLPKPVIGWFGVVDERVDYHLLAEVARKRPDWTLAVVGPVVKIDPNLLPHFPNLHWLGQRDYQQLPNYCAAFDVCMMCFALNKATEFINPTKALEYLATGKPVISTAVKDVVRQYPDTVTIAKDADDFVRKVEQLLHNPDKDMIQRGLELAKSKSWEGTVKSMRQNIKDAMTGSDRRSKKITPMADPEPGYFYQHTQGS
jgi:glycosyltransferase involved in cell wall biosynthesis